MPRSRLGSRRLRARWSRRLRSRAAAGDERARLMRMVVRCGSVAERWMARVERLHGEHERRPDPAKVDELARVVRHLHRIRDLQARASAKAARLGKEAS